MHLHDMFTLRSFEYSGFLECIRHVESMITRDNFDRKFCGTLQMIRLCDNPVVILTLLPLARSRVVASYAEAHPIGLSAVNYVTCLAVAR